MNDDAALYANHSGLQKKDAADVLDKYLKLFKWNNNDVILDAGAAEGSVSLKVLLPKLPRDFKKLVLCDIQENLLEYAKKRCNDQRVKFLVMDIASEKIPESLCHHFDHIFSFYCLQWVTGEKRHQQAIKNLYAMLKPGGNVLLTILEHAPCYDIFENMSRTEKWAPYTKNFKNYVPVYYRSKNPLTKLKYYLENAGFQIRVCEAENRWFTYPDRTHFMNFALSINPFVHIVPEDKRDDYIADLEQEKREHKLISVEVCEDGNEKFHRSYKILIVCAFKPL